MKPGAECRASCFLFLAAGRFFRPAAAPRSRSPARPARVTARQGEKVTAAISSCATAPPTRLEPGGNFFLSYHAARPGRAAAALRQPALLPALRRQARRHGPLRRAGLLQPGPRLLPAGMGPGARGGILGTGQGMGHRRRRAAPAAARRRRFPRRLAADPLCQRPGVARPRAIPAAPGPAQQRDPPRREVLRFCRRHDLPAGLDPRHGHHAGVRPFFLPVARPAGDAGPLFPDARAGTARSRTGSTRPGAATRTRWRATRRARWSWPPSQLALGDPGWLAGEVAGVSRLRRLDKALEWVWPQAVRPRPAG